MDKETELVLRNSFDETTVDCICENYKNFCELINKKDPSKFQEIYEQLEKFATGHEKELAKGGNVRAQQLTHKFFYHCKLSPVIPDEESVSFIADQLKNTTVFYPYALTGLWTVLLSAKNTMLKSYTNVVKEKCYRFCELSDVISSAEYATFTLGCTTLLLVDPPATKETLGLIDALPWKKIVFIGAENEIFDKLEIDHELTADSEIKQWSGQELMYVMVYEKKNKI